MDRLMHPPFSRLSDFIDGDLSRRRMTAVSRHLLRCSKCQETVDSLRLIQSVTQRLRSAPLQEQHRARVSGLADRENDLSGSIAPGGAEVDGQTPVGFEKHRNAVAAVGSVFLVVAGLFLIRTDAHSDTSELSFNNVRPTAGDIVRVKYVPDGRFSFGDKVVLRGEVYERDRPLSDQRERFVFLDTLERTHDSEYRGEFTWGIDDVVYVEFAVESPEADAVDRDPNWHLRSVGEQTLAALRQQYRRALSRHDTREAM